MEVSKDVARKLASCAGIVVGADGKGGSGTCVRLEDGQIAMLTAKHVVLECLRGSGELYISAPFFEAKLRRPRMARMDSAQQADAAFLVFNDPSPKIEPIPFDEWTTNDPELKVDTPVLACGFPGRLRAVDERTIKPQFGHLKDRILSLDGHTAICGIDESREKLPTFEGMSGGGLFSYTGRFLGIITDERRRMTSNYGEVHSLRPSGYEELYKPFKLPGEPPKGGYLGQKRSVAISLKNPDGSVLATVGCLAELLWASQDPTHPHARVGRLLTLEFIYPKGEMHYPINIESLFTWTDDSEEGQMAALRDEFKFLLMRMGWLLSDDNGTGTSAVQVNSLT
ncbi:MAG: S1 family peptidase [Elusimicrobiota bacterium]